MNKPKKIYKKLNKNKNKILYNEQTNFIIFKYFIKI